MFTQVPGTPEWFMAASTKTKVVAKNISRVALISEEATKYLAQKYQLTRDQITFGLPTADVRGTVLGDVCPVKVDFPCQVRNIIVELSYGSGHPKPPTSGISCLSLVLYGIRIGGFNARKGPIIH